MVKVIYHTTCFKSPDGESPEFKWDGFSMAGGAGYVCQACGDVLMLFDESDSEAYERLKNADARKNTG